jgi:tetratricopeptide (TPR) repeat protein
MSYRTSFLVVVAVALFWAAPVRAQEPAAAGSSAKERARVLHEQGLRHYEARRYARAIGAYRRAYALVPAPGILFNLAQAYRLKGDCRRAHRAYRSFLRAGGSSAEAQVASEHATALRPCAARAEKQKRAAELAARTGVGAAAAKGTGGATGSAAASAGGGTPSPNASPPQFSDGSPFDAPPAAEPADPLPAPAAEIARDDGTEPGHRKKLLGIGIGAAGGVLTAVGLYYAMRARGEASELDDFFASGGTWSEDLAAREDALGRNRGLAIGFGLFGAAALGTGAVFYWLGHKEATAAEAARRGSMSVVPQSDGAVLQWRGAF